MENQNLPSAVSTLTDAVEALHQACMEQNKSNFLQAALYHFHRLLNSEFVFTGQKNPDGSNSVETILVLHKGIIIPNFVYDLDNTPCEIILSRQTCVLHDNVMEEYQADEFFQEHKIRGYVGAPIINCYGRMNGVIVGLTRSAIPDPSTARTLSQLFSLAISHYFLSSKQ